jgi:hypothetical protein
VRERISLKGQGDRVVGCSFYLRNINFRGHVAPVSVFVVGAMVVDHPGAVKDAGLSKR